MTDPITRASPDISAALKLIDYALNKDSLTYAERVDDARQLVKKALAALPDPAQPSAQMSERINVIIRDYGLEKSSASETHDALIAVLGVAATPTHATPQEVQEACAQVADRAAAKLEEKARDLFKQRGEWEVRAARDMAYDIAESIRALIPPADCPVSRPDRGGGA